MEYVQIAEALLKVVLGLIDRQTAKATLDRVAVQMANEAADKAEREKFTSEH